MSEFELDDILGKYTSKPDPLAKPELMLVYSQPGAGKTHLTGTVADLPSVKKVLYLDVEGSTVGVLSRLDNADKIDVIRVDLQPDPFAFADTILKRLLGYRKSDGTEVPPEQTSYDVYVVDTFDVLQDYAIKHFTATAPISRSGEADGFAVWGNVKDWSLDIAKRLKKAQQLGIIVLHDREEKAKSGAITKKLMLSGSAKDVLPGIPDVVAYLERRIIDDKPQTVAYFGTDDGKVTKDRFNFPAKVVGATIPALFGYIDKQVEARATLASAGDTDTESKESK